MQTQIDKVWKIKMLTPSDCKDNGIRKLEFEAGFFEFDERLAELCLSKSFYLMV